MLGRHTATKPSSGPLEISIQGLAKFPRLASNSSASEPKVMLLLIKIRTQETLQTPHTPIKRASQSSFILHTSHVTCAGPFPGMGQVCGEMGIDTELLSFVVLFWWLVRKGRF